MVLDQTIDLPHPAGARNPPPPRAERRLLAGAQGGLFSVPDAILERGIASTPAALAYRWFVGTPSLVLSMGSLPCGYNLYSQVSNISLPLPARSVLQGPLHTRIRRAICGLFSHPSLSADYY